MDPPFVAARHAIPRVSFRTCANFKKKRFAFDGQRSLQPVRSGALAPCVETASGSQAGNDQSVLLLIPVGVGVTYHVDMLRRGSSIPLVPYVKAGIGYVFWSNSKAGGQVLRRPAIEGLGAVKGQGASFGFVWRLTTTATRRRRET